MNLYFITAPFPGDGCMENLDLWVRAESEDRAFELWSGYYELHDGGPNNHEPANGVYERADAEKDYEFGVELKKTYAEPAPAEGVIEWDVVKASTVGAL